MFSDSVVNSDNFQVTKHQVWVHRVKVGVNDKMI